MVSHAARLAFGCLSLLFVSVAAQAQIAPQAPAATPQERSVFADRLNGNTVSVVSGTISGTWITIAYDMSAVLDNGDELRVLPVVGKGSAQNIRDVLYLKGIDMGIVQANILQYFRKTGEAGKNIEQRLRYIARLYPQEIHVLGRPGVTSLQQLSGKKVNFAEVGSGSQVTAQLLFEKLRIPVQEVNMGQADAFEKMKTGEIEATFFSAGKPAAAFTKLINDNGFAFIQIPYTDDVTADFLPTTLTSDDYPNIIPKNGRVETLAESSVLVVYNWPKNSERYRRMELFTKAFFANFDKFLKPPRHPKWKEVNLAADLPGWQRFPAAQELLDSTQFQAVSNPARPSAGADTAAPYTEATSGGAQPKQEELFQKFMQWRDQQRPAAQAGQSGQRPAR